MAPGAVNVLVLAGTRSARDSLAEATGAPHRALVSLAGRPLLAHVLDALRRCEAVGRISVSMDEPGRRAAEAELPEPPDTWERGAASPVRSVLAHLDREAGLPLLITTADHALLTPSWVQEFLTEGLASGADLVIGVVSATKVLEAFPTSRRTVLRFSDEPLCGANLFLVLTRAARKAVEFWVHAEAHRKTPWKLVSTFGPTSLFRFLAGRLGFGEALEIAGKRLGVHAVGVRLTDPEAAIDVDRIADLELAEAILRRRETV